MAATSGWRPGQLQASQENTRNGRRQQRSFANAAFFRHVTAPSADEVPDTAWADIL
ncbi:MAG TPA: hypothetical protein VIC86_03165 [Acidimicrobiales bacterium]